MRPGAESYRLPWGSVTNARMPSAASVPARCPTHEEVIRSPTSPRILARLLLPCWFLAGCISICVKSVLRMVRFAKTDVDVVVARPPAPGRLSTSQLSDPGTQWGCGAALWVGQIV